VNLPRAVAHLRLAGTVLAVSRAYQSAAVGPPGQPDFVNAAALIQTDRSPGALRDFLRGVEAHLGRRQVRFAPIDLDLVLYDELVEPSAERPTPHPDLLARPYVAATVAELDPEAHHPVTHERLAEIARRLGGTSGLSYRPDIDLHTAG
jgi:2-amino-4-hydroxy-6-hydroxymethyldihydropteridine diphosphokinase